MCSSVNKCIQRRRKDILHSNWGVAMSQNQLDSRLVGRVLARLRAEKGITQEVLSGLSDIGRTHLSALERGERKPTLETLYRISNALDMPMSVIVAEIEKEIRENTVEATAGLRKTRAICRDNAATMRKTRVDTVPLCELLTK